jgi:hypothetical protein
MCVRCEYDDCVVEWWRFAVVTSEVSEEFRKESVVGI